MINEAAKPRGSKNNNYLKEQREREKENEKINHGKVEKN
jgi:hypothetical protein